MDAVIPGARTATRRDGRLRSLARRKSTIAFLMTLPLIALVAALVIYPALYSMHLAMLNESLERFNGFRNFALFTRETFWTVVKQSCIIAISAVTFKVLIGFCVAHFVHNVPAKKATR
jgi:multiple sugar transport system permease protein